MLLRYGWRPWKRYLLVFAVFVPLMLPQLHAFITVHGPAGRRQRSGMLLSSARLVEATFCSEAYLPWHPLAIAALVAFALLALVGVAKAVGLLRADTQAAAMLKKHGGLASIVLFSLSFFFLVALSGLGIRPRNGLLLMPALAPLAALLVETLRPILLQYAFVAFFGLWSAVGIEHLLSREGLAKSDMINRPEEVVDFLRDSRGPDCSIVVTYDALLTMTLSTSDLPRLLVLSDNPSPVYHRGQPFDPATCPRIDLYLVTSYTGGRGNLGDVLTGEMVAETRALQGQWNIHSFSSDPDAARKRKLSFISGATDLPDYRYVVASTEIPAARLDELRRELPHFGDADGPSKLAKEFSSRAGQ
jgi:hypothetical protein